MENIFTQRQDLSDLNDAAQRLRAEVGKLIVGQHKLIDHLLVAILADGHVLIEGVPGVAKTLAAKLVARCIGAGFSRIQFTPDLMPSDVLGTSVFNLSKSEFEFKPGPIFSNIILIDEINRAPAKTQSALFEVMEERQATIDGNRYTMDKPFIVLATQNPIEQEGTYRLPEAQLDRFLFKIEVDYPSLDEELMILTNHHQRVGIQDIEQVKPVISVEQLTNYRRKIQEIHIEEPLRRYIAQIVQQTRKSPFLYLGASPRASLAIMTAAKAFAAIRGRDFVSPEDIKEICYPVLTHRLLMTPEKEMEGTPISVIIKSLIESIEIPR